MATTDFTNAVTLTDAEWFNDTDYVVYDGSASQMLVGAGPGTRAVWSAPATLVLAGAQASYLAITLASEQASTSGTSIDFTSIPAGVRRIVVMFNSVSTSGTSNFLIQLGDSGGVENTGYVMSGLANGAEFDSTAGFVLAFATAANTHSGCLILNLEDSTDYTWTAVGGFTNGTNALFVTGIKALSAELDRVRITTVGGSDTFDAGAINISYEK